MDFKTIGKIQELLKDTDQYQLVIDMGNNQSITLTKDKQESEREPAGFKFKE